MPIDKWFSSKAYRKKVANRTGLEFTDAGLNDICSIGSSFNNRSYQGKAQQMDVLNRWKEFDKDVEFNNILDDNEIKDLWSTIQEREK